ncbi:hypothetical protein LCGC14_1801070, partial [marine sediment metagenome]
MTKKILKTITQKSNNLLQRLVYELDFRINNPMNRLLNDFQHLFRKNGLNICYNRFISRDYKLDKKNILIAIDSPAVVEYRKWLKPEMEFIAEISFANYYNLKHYYCPRELYIANDTHVYLKPSREYKKNRLVSMIYSNSKILEGHKFRHKVAELFKDQIDRYGTGADPSKKTTDLKKIITLDKYMFQIAIENGKYPEYVSEKFYDCVKTRTIPIYPGGEKAIKKMGFDREGILFFDTIEDLEKIFDEKVSKSTYKKKKDAIDYNLKRLIEIRNERKLNFFFNTLK